MNGFAQPVTRDPFLYHGELFVDPGNKKHYKRALPVELTALLKSGSSEKDETAPYYEAQLVHFGLKRTKDKARAKWRLLEAVNGKTLRVPEDLLKVEKELKKEYETANKKSKNASTTTGLTGTSGEGTAGKKRKKPEDSHVLESSLPAAKKSQKAKAKDSFPVSKGNPTSASNKTSTKAISTFSTHDDEAPVYKTKQTARSTKLDKIWRESGGTIGRGPVKPGTPASPPRPTQKKVASEPKKSEPKETKPKEKGNEPSSMSKSTKASDKPLQISGIYPLDCPEISSTWSGSETELSLLVQNSSYESGFCIWGQYELGPFNGVLRSSSTEFNGSSSLSAYIEWRGREDGEVEMMFGSKCKGFFTVSRNGKIKGAFHGMYGKSVDFSGNRMPGSNGAVQRTVSGFEAEFESINEDAYEYERVHRWG